jgi:protein-S-isoprenylcysteine O-methyltransferase Ste14
MVACVAVGYAYRIHVEEAMLVSALGQPYSEYMRRTARLVPFVI